MRTVRFPSPALTSQVGAGFGLSTRAALVAGHVRATCVPCRRSLRAPAAPCGGRCSTRCYHANMSMPEITQRDLRSRSREIMDAVEHGQAFTVTRDGHQIGELIPIRRRRRFVSRQEFSAMSRNVPADNLDAFRADQDATADHEDGDPYDR